MSIENNITPKKRVYEFFESSVYFDENGEEIESSDENSLDEFEKVCKSWISITRDKFRYEFFDFGITEEDDYVEKTLNIFNISLKNIFTYEFTYVNICTLNFNNIMYNKNKRAEIYFKNCYMDKNVEFVKDFKLSLNFHNISSKDVFDMLKIMSKDNFILDVDFGTKIDFGSAVKTINLFKERKCTDVPYMILENSDKIDGDIYVPKYGYFEDILMIKKSKYFFDKYFDGNVPEKYFQTNSVYHEEIGEIFNCYYKEECGGLLRSIYSRSDFRFYLPKKLKGIIPDDLSDEELDEINRELAFIKLEKNCNKIC